ncbi:MAG: hypothetical protein EOO04_09465, partial [Chitinophagaceae bacterium]
MIRLYSNKRICLTALVIMILAAPLLCFSQTTGKNNTDSLPRTEISKADSTVLAKATSLFKSGDIQQGKSLFIKTIEKIRIPGYENTEAGLWHKLALLIPSRDTIGITRLYCLRKMHELYKQAGNEERQIEALKCIADLHLVQGRLDLAETQLLDVLERLHRLPDA